MSRIAAPAKDANNIAQTLIPNLRERVRMEREQCWLMEHAEYIAAHNQSIEEEGLPLEQYRMF